MKILYVTTLSTTVNSFLVPHIEMLVCEGHHVDVAFNIAQEVKKELYELGCEVYEISFSRSPLNKNNIKAYKQLKQLIRSRKYDLVHCHTPVASAITRLACRNLVDIKVYYTAHGFHFYKGASLVSWLIYYPLEKWLSRYTDTIITINNEDYERAKKKLYANRAEYIPGVGLDIDKFRNVKVNRVKKRIELGIPADAFVILSVGELNKNKNQEVILKAIAKLDNPKICYAICGTGALDEFLTNLAKKLGVEKRFILLGYRTDVLEIYKIADVFAFPSKREGLPVSMMEAMASGLPVICSKIRGNVDLITIGLMKKDSIDKYVIGITELLKNNNLKNKLVKINAKKINNYSNQKVLAKLADIYQCE